MRVALIPLQGNLQRLEVGFSSKNFDWRAVRFS